MMVIHPNSNKELFCLPADQPIKIDGQLNEWGNGRSITIQDKSQKSEANAVIKTLWNNENLFIAFQVQDADLKAEQTVLDHPELYLDDMVEFLIDTQNNKDTCWNEDDIIYHINLLGQKKDDRGTVECITNPKWNGDAEFAIQLKGTLNNATDIDSGYMVEVRVSWKELGLIPVPGLKIGLNFAIGDNGILFDWVNASPFRSPDAFGNVVLH
jgi:hypothetical protein